MVRVTVPAIFFLGYAYQCKKMANNEENICKGICFRSLYAFFYILNGPVTIDRKYLNSLKTFTSSKLDEKDIQEEEVKFTNEEYDRALANIAKQYEGNYVVSRHF